MLETTEDPNGIVDAASQLISIIEKHIKDSFGDSNYHRVIAEMTALRQEMIEMEEPSLWNDWLKKLKEKLRSDGLGTGRDELWWRIRKDKLGLVVNSEMEVSDIGDDEARQVWDRLATQFDGPSVLSSALVSRQIMTVAATSSQSGPLYTGLIRLLKMESMILSKVRRSVQ